MGITEALDLRPEDLDAKKEQLQVRRKKRQDGYEQTLPIPTELVADLRLYIEENGGRRDRPLFDISRVTAYRWCKKLGHRVLDRKVTPHMFRHGCVYQMLQEGIHPLVISRAMGHASVISVLSYVHPSEEDIRAALSS